MRSTGIIGGSFDPIHYGHLLLAEQAADACDLDQVIFMPAAVSPFKIGKPPAADSHRIEMTRLAVKNNPKFTVSDMEIKKEGASYTIETLEACRGLYGNDTRIFFICGTDSFLGMENWYEAEKILKQYAVIVGSRPRYKDKSRDEMIEKLRTKYGAQIEKIHMPKIDLSSTEIKKRIAEGRSIRYMVPEAVEDYIHRNHIYQPLV